MTMKMVRKLAMLHMDMGILLSNLEEFEDFGKQSDMLDKSIRLSYVGYTTAQEGEDVTFKMTPLLTKIALQEIRATIRKDMEAIERSFENAFCSAEHLSRLKIDPAAVEAEA